MDARPPQSSNQSGSKTVSYHELSHKVPNKARQEMAKAERALAKNRRDEAITHFKQAIAMDPEFEAARNNLGILYLDLKRPEDGIAQLKEAAKIDPHKPGPFINLAIGYAMIDKFETSEHAARTLLSLDPTDDRGPLLLGFALVMQRKLNEEALNCFERAHNKYPMAYLLSARFYEAKGDLERAKSELRTYLTTGEQMFREDANYWLGRLSEGEQKSVALLPR